MKTKEKKEIKKIFSKLKKVCEDISISFQEIAVTLNNLSKK
jgi:hypothetical protein